MTSRPVAAGVGRRRAAPGGEAIVLSQLYPPAVGGSAELIGNIYTRFDGLPVTVLTGTGNAEQSAPPGGRVISAGRWASGWGLLHPGSLWSHLRRTATLRRLSSGHGCVVHCGRALPEGLDGLFARRLGGAPYLCWACGEELAYARASREIRMLMALAFRQAAAVIAISRNTADLLAPFGVPADRIVVVYPGVDARRFRPDHPGAPALRSRLAPAGQLLILTVGRLQRRKGHDLVLRALARLGRSAVDVRYVVVGTGEEEPRLRQLARDLGVEDRVLFVGRVAADELPAYYAAADLFVHPNRVDGDDFEGFGIVFLEAAAAGLPAIAGNSGGAPEAVQDGVTGLLVTGLDPDELRSALETLASSFDLRRRLGDAGRARVRQSFSWDRAAAEVTRIHDRVLSQQNGLPIAQVT